MLKWLLFRSIFWCLPISKWKLSVSGTFSSQQLKLHSLQLPNLLKMYNCNNMVHTGFKAKAKYLNSSYLVWDLFFLRRINNDAMKEKIILFTLTITWNSTFQERQNKFDFLYLFCKKKFKSQKIKLTFLFSVFLFHLFSLPEPSGNGKTKYFRFYHRCHWIVHVKFTTWCVNVGNATKWIDQVLEKFIYFYNERIWVTNHPCCFTNEKKIYRHSRKRDNCLIYVKFKI